MQGTPHHFFLPLKSTINEEITKKIGLMWDTVSLTQNSESAT
jgi:hypothetical protein